MDGPPATGGTGTRRVFLALLCGPHLGQALGAMTRAALGGAGAERDFRLPRAAGLHLTLLFLGDVGPPALARLRAELGPAAGGLRGPRLVLGSAGAFPRRGAERVLWIGVQEEAGSEGRLAELRRAALGAAERAGLDVAEERARPFHPHVTVARPRGLDRSPQGHGAGGARGSDAAPRLRRGRGARVPEAFHALAPGLAWRPAALALVESVRGEGPAEYRALDEVPLEEA